MGPPLLVLNSCRNQTVTKLNSNYMDIQFLLSLIVGVFIGGVAGYLGSLMITKKMALAGDALGHIALPGMGLALLFGFDVFWGALLFLIPGVLLIWLFSLKTSLPLETLVGVIFVSSLAIGFLIIPEFELVEALIGDISRVSLGMTIVSVILSAAVFFGIRWIYPGLLLSHISEDLAAIQGVKTKKCDLIYLLLAAVVVALGVRITGSLLVGALVIIPAAIARNLSRSLKEYSFFSAVIGALSSVLGIFLFRFLNLPAGPLIILVNFFFFLASLFFKKSGVKFINGKEN